MQLFCTCAPWKRVLLRWCALGVLASAALGVVAPHAAAEAKLPVAASIVPLGDFCRQVGGDRVDVMVLIPPGASPHVFEPRPSVVAKAARAKLFVYVGANLEPWARRLLGSSQDRDRMVVEAAQGLPLVRDAGDPHVDAPPREEREGRGTPDHGVQDHVEGNPHVWLDPVLAQEISKKIAHALALADPAHSRTYQTRLEQYLGRLDALHRETQQRVAAFRIRHYVAFHPSFVYFARRYGLREEGVIEEAPGREPTPGQLQRIAAAIRKHGIRAVFAEPQLNPRAAEVIAREAGVKVMILDPMGGRPPYGSDYIQLMRYNVSVMEEAMR